MKTASCPSCGASATNHQNCEFCGSLFVRAAHLNYSVDDFSLKNVENNSYPGLKEEFDLNLLLRTLYRCDYFHTEIYQSRLEWLNLTTDTGVGILRVHNLSGQGTILKDSLSIEIEEFSLNPVQIESLKRLKEYVFFEYHHDPSGNGFWLINFGADTTGAAYFVSTLLKEVYKVDANASVYSVTIAENLFSDNEEENRWWVEKASSEFKERHNRGAEKFGWFTRNEDGSINKPQEKNGCFIATATMGDHDHPDVVRLRRFRDMWILKQNWGEDFVKWYYKHGEKPAEVIKNNVFLKVLSYIIVVKPLLLISRIVRK
jgi:hypothetical protein